MKIPLLAAKLNKPQLPDHLIIRDLLLKNCELSNVILVSAQAGSGKSTAVSAWLEDQGKAYCWYALDDWDNDLMQFFAYLIEGLKGIDRPSSEALCQLLDDFQSIGFEAFLRTLITRLHGISAPFILVFDDYHIIRNDQIHQVITTLLEHFPPSMQLVLITREDPPFPLAKMRSTKKLAELRISQLRFTEEEVKAYFLQQLHISLEDEQIRQLLARTEGWIAGLQMTALSMQGIEDIERYIETFADSHYYIMDYLIEEVLERQTPEIKNFLLQTSILDFFSDDLCDAVVESESGSSRCIIEKLLKSNSFIICTDPSHRWYRYHHLFRELLNQRLEQQAKNQTPPLHLKAGVWLKKNGFEQEAIHHFLKATAFEEAAALIECKWYEMDMQLQSSSWLDMAKKLPEAIVERSPVLLMGYGWALLDMGDGEACTPWFDKALHLYERNRSNGQTENSIICDKTQFDLLPATIASAYAYIAAATRDIEGIFFHARYALERIPREQYIKRGVVEMLLGIAHWENGDFHEAESAITGAYKCFEKTANPQVENSYFMVLGELCVQRGDLDRAKVTFEQTISRLIRENLVTILLPSLYMGLAKVAYLQRDNRKAYELLEESKTHSLKSSLMDWEYKYYLLLARIYCSEGLYDLARDCIKESRVHYYMNPISEDISIDDVETQIEAASAKDPHRQLPGTKNDSKAEWKSESIFKKEYVNQSLAEPLTSRELEVLSLIIAGLSNQEICDKLFLALSTVKGYNQNIFGKLAVNRRTQAVVKAKELGLG